MQKGLKVGYFTNCEAIIDNQKFAIVFKQIVLFFIKLKNIHWNPSVNKIIYIQFFGDS